jgi:hypothetical protein
VIEEQGPDAIAGTIGVDAARFLLVGRSHDTTLELDIDLAVQQNNQNPVYYVQYAHARICSILKNLPDGGERPAGEAVPAVTVGPQERALLRALARFPDVLRRRGYAPPHRVRYLGAAAIPCSTDTASSAAARTFAPAVRRRAVTLAAGWACSGVARRSILSPRAGRVRPAFASSAPGAELVELPVWSLSVRQHGTRCRLWWYCAPLSSRLRHLTARDGGLRRRRRGLVLLSRCFFTRLFAPSLTVV